MRNEGKMVGRRVSDRVRGKVAARQNRGGSGYLLLPEGVEFFKPKKEATFRFNIIPYVVGDHNLEIPKGELDYDFTFWVHNIDNGETRQSVVCPKKTYGKKCPICEMVERLSKDYAENEDDIKRFKAKQRQLYNVVDARDDEQKVQVYETAYYKSFGEMLDKRIRTQDDEDDEDYNDFADIPGGRTLKVAYVEETFNGSKYYAPSSIDFVARKEELSVDIIDKAVCLDSCLKTLSYDEIMKLLADDDVAEEVKEEKPKSRPVRGVQSAPKAKPVEPKKEDKAEDDDNDDDVAEEVKEEKPVVTTRKRSFNRPEPVEDDDEDEEEEETKPAKPAKRTRPKPVEDDDEDEEEEEKKEVDDDEEDDDDDDPKPAKKTKCKGCGGKCPYGYSFGADCYIYEECDTCDFVDECDAAQ